MGADYVHCDVCGHNAVLRTGERLTLFYVICLVHKRQECDVCHAKETGNLIVHATKEAIAQQRYADSVMK